MPFITELWKRLRKSINDEDGTHYCFAEQLFTEVRPHALQNGLKQLMTREQQEQEHVVMNYCKVISDFITVPQQTLEDDHLNNLVAANILLACQHPTILDLFPIYKFVIIKFVKLETQGL